MVLEMQNLRKKDARALTEVLKDCRKQLVDVVNDAIKGKEKNVHKATALRKKIARIMTTMKEKEILASAEEVT
ncbi:50S ribosomal protein L29 [candidate division WWE3 bacterium]|nr:50S ribosomal protein L29 [candidate division WWE3 bacterium]